MNVKQISHRTFPEKNEKISFLQFINKYNRYLSQSVMLLWMLVGK